MKIEKIEKLVTNLNDKSEYVIHIRKLRESLNHGLILKRVHRVIKVNQKACLKPYIDINIKLRQKAKNNFEKDYFKLISNAVFVQTIKLWTKWDNIEMLNLWQQKGKEII